MSENRGIIPGAIREPKGRRRKRSLKGVLVAFAADSLGKLNIALHNRDPIGVDGAEVGVLEEADEEGFRGFLQGSDGR
jgi:hypothetical protein